MAVPKSKISRSRRGMRRSHDSLSEPKFVKCNDTGELHQPGHCYTSDGQKHYKGVRIETNAETED